MLKKTALFLHGGFPNSTNNETAVCLLWPKFLCVFGAKSQLSKIFCCVFDLARGWCAEVGATASARSVPATKAGQAKHATARLPPRQIKWDTG